MFWLWFGLFLTTQAARFGYERLKETGTIDTRNRAVFLAIFAVMGAMWISWFNMAPADPVRLSLPGMVRGAGLVLMLAGTVLALGAFLQLRGVENIDHLVTGGLFAKFRHPMYVGFMSWIIGWGTYHAAGLSLLAGLAGIGNILYWMHLEDRALAAAYGETYENYKAKTWL